MKDILKKLGRVFLSSRFMGLTFILFAISMAVGTFIENDFDTQTAKNLIYESWWFELIMMLLALHFLVNIKRYKLWRREKRAVLIFHLGFVVTLLGGGITRYLSYEGVMHIRKNEVVNHIISEKTYLKLRIDNNHMQRIYTLPWKLSKIGDNHISKKISFLDHTIEITNEKYIPNAIEKITFDDHGSDIIHLVISKNGQRENFYLSENETKKIGQGLFNTTSNQPVEGLINLRKTLQGNWKISFPQKTFFIKMATQDTGSIAAKNWTPLLKRSLYQMNSGFSFVIKEIYLQSKIEYTSAETKEEGKEDLIQLKLTTEKKNNPLIEEHSLIITGGRGTIKAPKELKTNELNIYASYGAIQIPIPFALRLDEFELLRYPGSNSPSSFKSKITLIDDNQKKQHEIFMNNVLDHQGYRFFQSSYDQDELGTILSVNHDVWGTRVSYIGYFLLFSGMFFTLFSKKSRFWTLSKKVSKLKKEKVKILIALFFMITPYSWAQQSSLNGKKLHDTEQLIQSLQIPKEQALAFSKLWTQDLDGRIKPLHTLASEILRKVYHKNSFQGMSPEEVLLSVTLYPMKWQLVDIVYIKNKAVRSIFDKKKYARFFDFFDKEGNYLLSEKVNSAHQKKPASRNDFDKEIISLDERLYVWYSLINGSIIKIFPLPNSPKNKWVSASDHFSKIPTEDSIFIRKIIPFYKKSFSEGKQNNNWEKAKEKIAFIQEYQTHHGASILPTEGKRKAEIFYNKISIFKRLSSYYSLLGILMIIMNVWQVFSSRKVLKFIQYTLLVAAIILFGIHTSGLILRWYISGHAPWSNGYESMIYVGWATVLSGIFFSRKSPLSLSSTVFLAGIILWVAGLNWLDPEITNLVPVLKSYWLMIHVAIIVASYGFFALGALLSLLSLCFMAFGKISKGSRVLNSIKELSCISEMGLTVGLFMLSIGTFLGGIWANESWGRYWSWDPKETWALISIIVYAFVLHMRFIPKMGNLLSYNLGAVISFGSILMTYFGVNYFLGGLHSYAKGDPIPIPNALYYSCAIILSVYLLARFRQKEIRKIKI